MVVITVSCCPKKLRGDLTKWLFEIDTGVFVGNLNARVRDAVWDRVCSNIGNGRASMVFNTNNEQKLDFRIHNTEWQPIDYDGIKLVVRRLSENENSTERTKTKAEQQHINRLTQRKKVTLNKQTSYVVVDIETTGLDSAKDEIIEIGALKVEEGVITKEFSVLLKNDVHVPDDIVELTGITDDVLEKEGVDIKKALEKFREFCEDSELVGHNVNFDLQFLQREFIKNGFPPMRNKTTDTMRIARRKIESKSGHKLQKVAEYFGIVYNELYRALSDCYLTYEIYEKLREL